MKTWLEAETVWPLRLYHKPEIRPENWGWREGADAGKGP